MAHEAAGGSPPEVPVASTYPLTDAPASGLMPSGSPSGQPAARGEVASRGGGSEGHRVKRPDFHASENMTLVLAIIENWNSLYGAGARRVGSEAKMRIWSSVARRVSALGFCLRDVRACQKRYGDIRSRIKLKMVRLSEMRQGVSGRRRAPPQFTEYEDLLRPYVPEVTVEGVSTFGDTSLMAAGESYFCYLGACGFNTQELCRASRLHLCVLAFPLVWFPYLVHHGKYYDVHTSTTASLPVDGVSG